MGNNLIGQSKLQYFPTQDIETYKMFKYFMIIDFKSSYTFKYEIKDKILTPQEYEKISVRTLDGEYYTLPYSFYDWCIDNDKFEYLDKYLTFRLNVDFNGDNNNNITVADLFAGEGKWLETFKNFIAYNNEEKVKLIGNEIEENRYNTMKECNIIDECYYGSFEELKIPKKSISLMLYNPPYNETNGVRNCKHYLNMILDRELIYINDNDTSRKTGDIIMVIREDDFLDSLELIIKNFEIRVAYKVNSDEFSKWKQWVIFASLRYVKLNDGSNYVTMSIQESINKFKNIISDGRPYNQSAVFSLTAFNYKQVKENFEVVNDLKNNNTVSKADNVFKWIKDVTEVKDMSVEKLLVPKPLKQGEIANLISAGYINGELSLNDGTGRHIAVGGTKNMTKTEIRQEKNDKGEKIIITEELRFTQPYLNILCNKNGKLEIIELGDVN